MNTEQRTWLAATGWSPATARLENAQLVLIFGASGVLDDARVAEVRRDYPAAAIVGCSTAGEIQDEHVNEDSIVITAVQFTATTVRIAIEDITNPADSRATGHRLGERLAATDLVHVMVFSDGLGVNGSELAAGLRDATQDGVAITGGLAGDGDRFARTLVVPDGPPRAGAVVAVGLCGNRLKVGYGSLGGWDAFGVDRLITRAHGNVLYELDGEPALRLYKRYLGDYAVDLPAAGLLFPLALRDEAGDVQGLVRTILAVNEEDQSMTFAGDMPEGMYARLMKANFDRLVDGAAGAATAAGQGMAEGADLALLISCVGRKLVLKQRVEEEVESVRHVLGPRPALTGFYSYGEISPHVPLGRCELHNQTMTITTFAET